MGDAMDQKPALIPPARMPAMVLPEPNVLIFLFLAAMCIGLAKSGLLVSIGTAAVPLLAFALPAKEAAGLLLPVLIAGDIVALSIYRREVSWPVLVILLPACLLGVGVGWAFFAFVSEAVVRIIIGVVALLFVLDAWLGLRKKLIETTPSKGWGLFWGAVTGFTSFISHTGGPPYQIYVLPLKLSPAIFAGTTAVFFFVLNTSKLVPYYFLGQLTVSNLELAALAIPVVFASMAVGVFLVRRVDPGIFYKIAYVLLLLLAINLIWEGTAILLET